MEAHRINPDVTVLADSAEVPGIGHLPVNAFVLHAEQPVVVDTGLSTPDKDFVADLARVIDPADVRWIWITHPDRDHTGGLWDLLDAAPDAKVITTFLGVGIMSTQWEMPLHRMYFLNPGDSLDVGDRVLTGHRPPLFDSPATVGFLDQKSGAFFSSDCFGAPASVGRAGHRRRRPAQSPRTTCRTPSSCGRPSTARGCTRWTGRSTSPQVATIRGARPAGHLQRPPAGRDRAQRPAAGRARRGPGRAVVRGSRPGRAGGLLASFEPA